MTANQTKAGAVSNINDWHSVRWREVNQNVRRLQARIVQATQEMVKPRSKRSVTKA